MFRPLAPRTVRWRPLQGEGLEHMSIEATPAGVVARSVVIGSQDGAGFGAAWQIRCDTLWRTREVRVRAADGRTLALDSDGEGRWSRPDGAPLPAFDGCMDVDLSATPFSNTLPIRRLSLDLADGTAELRMVYVPFDTLEPFVDGQRYTCLLSGRLYRYQAVDGSFSADLPVDEDGLVTDYPTLFARV
ncbi:putative glycolipid-binding domain-containing protein [Aureimonas mangrovi]|uniref:putative glycolipid-binding domain-containing protein n=1 Tax=Aureimonas mangrovi TaxID=2758041 RepID=UPI00163DC2BF|nr:putative glycolipid-binding domain-containing protein [Aureimonas mangrovi]